MLHNNLSRINLAIALIFFFILIAVIPAADFITSPKVSVTMIADAGFTQTEKFVYEVFQKVLRERDIYSETGFQIEYLIDAKSVSTEKGNKLIISITCLQSLPKEIVELNKKEQSFYLATTKQNLPDTPEGEKIREQVSEEYIKQARIVTKNYLEIIDQSETEDYIQEIVNEIFIK